MSTTSPEPAGPVPDPSRVENLFLGTWDEVSTEITYGLADATQAERVAVLCKIGAEVAQMIAEEAALLSAGPVAAGVPDP